MSYSSEINAVLVYIKHTMELSRYIQLYSSCFQSLEDDVRFCPKCGTPLASDTSLGDVVRDITTATVDSAMYAVGRASEISDSVFKDPVISKRYDLKPCPFCDGEGTHPMDFDETCPVCRSAGQNRIRIPCAQC
jgi:hypothetical protein